jgi:hypothetical protein
MEIKTLNMKDSTFIYYYKSTKQHTSLVDEIQDIGYIQFSIHEDEVNISYIYIHPEKRGSGLAENLFVKMFSRCVEDMKSRNPSIITTLKGYGVFTRF